eukprot:gene12612-14477_t
MQPISELSTVLPLVAVIVGAAFGYVSGRQLESRKLVLLQKGQAYADYLKALATTATDRKSSAVMGLAVDAKTRVCIYGSSKVIRALGNFEEAGAYVARESGRAAIAQLIQAMRADLGERGSGVAESDLHLVLFGPENV